MAKFKPAWGSSENLTLEKVPFEEGRIYFTKDTKEIYLDIKEDGSEERAAFGGVSGTTDYSDLSNKPSVGGVTLDGNKTLAQLGISAESTLSSGTKIGTVLGKDLYAPESSGSSFAVDATLLASGWDEDTKRQTVSVEGFEKEGSNLFVGLSDGVSDEARKAAAVAAVSYASCEDGEVTFEVRSIPSADIPITLVVF